jgi:hypothetical protein
MPTDGVKSFYEISEIVVLMKGIGRGKFKAIGVDRELNQGIGCGKACDL